MGSITYMLIKIPEKHFGSGEPAFELIKKSGYVDAVEKIEEDDIFREIERHPETIKDWMDYSASKRTHEGWYFNENSTGKYVVGYMGNPGIKDSVYEDEARACAAFIKREVDDVVRECAEKSGHNIP